MAAHAKALRSRNVFQSRSHRAANMAGAERVQGKSRVDEISHGWRRRNLKTGGLETTGDKWYLSQNPTLSTNR